MPHIDPEELSLLALYGDWLDEEGRQHLSGCDACSAEYAALRRAVDAMKTTPDSSTLEVPGPSVWSGIHRELGLSDAIREDPPLGSAAGSATGTETSKPGINGPTEPEQPAAPPADIRSVKKRPQGWQRRGTWLAVAAAGAWSSPVQPYGTSTRRQRRWHEQSCRHLPSTLPQDRRQSSSPPLMEREPWK